MRRIGVVVGIAVLGLALAGCGGAPAPLDLGIEGQALAAAGFEQADPAPSTSPSVSERRERRKDRALLRKNVLHGEVVVRTKDGGTKTVAVQRGEVTAIDDSSMTVKSSDGYTATWTFGDALRVVERRKTVQPSDVTPGTQVGVAGAKDGDKYVARLIVLRR
jgi:hypothetical protein